MPFTDNTKRQAYNRDGGKCQICVKEGNPNKGVSFASAEFHHVQPESSGGPDTLANCATVHAKCHDWLHESPSRVGQFRNWWQQKH